MTEEKEKTPANIEIEDITGLSGYPATNTVPAKVEVKVEEEEDMCPHIRYIVKEVSPPQPAQPVVFGHASN
jgi:hypothetical protein